jgi:hypothetical protein
MSLIYCITGMLHLYCSSETAEWMWVKLESTLNELWQPQGFYYEDCCCTVQQCHHIWYVTAYIVSPYMVCDSLHGVTIYGMWQSTWCHHTWYVTVYMLSPHNSNCHCWLLLNFHTLLEILSLRPFDTHFSFCIFTCSKYLYVFKLNSTFKAHLYIISLEIRSRLVFVHGPGF